MTRWAWAGAVAAACAGFSAGQSPPAPVSVAPPAVSSPPGATDGPRAGDVITFRTAGQPERRVKVLRVTASAGGEPLADLQDLTTGARYTVPARMLTAKPAAPKAAPVRPTQWTPAARPTTPPAIGGSSAAVPASGPYSPFTKPRYAPKDDRPASPAVAVSSPAVVPPPQLPLALPEPLARERPLPPPAEPPTLVAFRPPPRVEVSVEPAVPAVAVVRAVAPPASPIRQAALLVDPVPLSAAPGPAVPAGDPMADETGPYLRDLFEALRPSVRERAATALAECRYGSRPEVKAQLAKAAAEDPCPDVRAHCVGLLAKLGYHESRYLDDLAAWAESGPPAVQQAARAALAKLAPKN
jgi:hypothetical protein